MRLLSLVEPEVAARAQLIVGIEFSYPPSSWQRAHFAALWAMTQAPIGAVAALRETSVLYGL